MKGFNKKKEKQKEKPYWTQTTTIGDDYEIIYTIKN